jgi:hypothetical protein
MRSVTREQRQVNGKALLSDAIAAGEEALAQMVVRRLNELLLMAVTDRNSLILSRGSLCGTLFGALAERRPAILLEQTQQKLIRIIQGWDFDAQRMTRWMARIAHQGGLMGMAIRDHQANICDVSIVHMAGGKVVEEQTSSALVLNRLPNCITCNLLG